MVFSPGSDEIYKESLALHALHKGKLEIHSKVSLKTRQDLRVHTPRELPKSAGK